jgi:antitoxin FitA
MASLSVRKLEDEIYEKLRRRASEHGVSMEEEARRILARAVAAPERLGDLALGCFGPEHGVDGFERIGREGRHAHGPLSLEPIPAGNRDG